MKYLNVVAHFWLISLLAGIVLMPYLSTVQAKPKPRILISTDIGGTDPDDFQSMIHLLMYADRFKIEGLVASPYGNGRKKNILDIVDLYEKDLNQLKKHAPVSLRPVHYGKSANRGPSRRLLTGGSARLPKVPTGLLRAQKNRAISRFGYWYGAVWKIWPRPCTMPPTSRKT